ALVTIRIIVDQISGETDERHKASVGADYRGGGDLLAAGDSRAGTLVAAAGTGAVDADQSRGARLQVAHKALERAIGIIGVQIARCAAKGHKATIGAGGVPIRGAVAAAGTGAVDADQTG